MEIYALCDRPLRSIPEWQTAIDALGFGLQLRSDRDLATSSGHLPALWRGREAGFECGLSPFDELAGTYDDIDLGGPWTCVYALYFGTLPSLAGAWFAAAACVSVTGGAVFDTHDGVLLSADHAVAYARRMEADVDRLEAQGSGLRPS